MKRADAPRWTVPLVVSLALLAGCGRQQQRQAADATYVPKVLIIGDSISIGYFEPTKQLLEGRAEVYHNPGNAAHTANGLARLDEWLGDTRWDVIHFNHGLHDLKYMNEKGDLTDPAKGTQQIPIDQYARNLDELTKRLKKTGAVLIFATTTPVPEGSAGRIQGDAKRYNEAALKVMKKRRVRVDDLYAFALPRLDTIQRPHNVHFTDEGSRLLAEQVAASIREALDR
jgi:lysophospholipase L1-like esterase